MELKDFVEASLIQIMHGISGANDKLGETNAIINPKDVYVNGGTRQNYGRLDSKNHNPVVELIEFDIAVYASEETEKSGKVGISVCSVSLGGGGKKQESNRSESRIKFKIPVVFPVSKKKE